MCLLWGVRHEISTLYIYPNLSSHNNGIKVHVYMTWCGFYGMLGIRWGLFIYCVSSSPAIDVDITVVRDLVCLLRRSLQFLCSSIFIHYNPRLAYMYTGVFYYSRHIKTCQSLMVTHMYQDSLNDWPIMCMQGLSAWIEPYT